MSADDGHRAAGMLEDVVADRTQRRLGQRTVASRPDRDHGRRVRGVDQRLAGTLGDELAVDLDLRVAGPCFGHRLLQRVFFFFFLQGPREWSRGPSGGSRTSRSVMSGRSW